MVKEKKLTKSSIAIIVLALLLIASLIMGMTGAWFTQTGKVESGSKSIQFGHITNNLDGNLVAQAASSTSTADARAVPGDSITLGQVTVDYTADIDTYLFLRAELVMTIQYKDDAEAHPASAEEIAELFGSSAGTNLAALMTLTQNAGEGNPAMISGTKVEAPQAIANGQTGKVNGYNYYLFQATNRADEDYRVQYVGGANVTLTVQDTVTNHQVNSTEEGHEEEILAHNWTDAIITVSYKVSARVCQAEHIVGNAATDDAKALAAWTAAGFTSDFAA